MPTRFGGRQRPDLKIVRWILLGPDGTALPSPSTPALPPAASAKAQLDQFAESAEAKAADPAEPVESAKPAKPAKPGKKASGFHEVDPPSLSEHMGGDKVSW
jgi:hypothetical protein